MNTSIKSKSKDQASQAEAVDERCQSWNLPIGTTLSGAEELEEANRDAGWTTEYRQLDAGALDYGARTGEFGGITFLHEYHGKRMEVFVEPYRAGVEVLIPIGNGSVRINGHSIERGNLIIFTPQSDLEVLGYAGVEMLSFGIPSQLFERSLNNLGSRRSSLTPGQSIPITDCAAKVECLIRSVQSAGNESGADVSPEAMESQIASSLANLFQQATGTGLTQDRYFRLQKRRALVRAREYIDSHLDDTISMPELCASTAVSLSTLERMFRRELQMTPTAYIQSRRLDAVRRILLADTDCSNSIAEIARDHGLVHPGRFSVMFRQQFGVRPGDLRREAVKIR